MSASSYRSCQILLLLCVCSACSSGSSPAASAPTERLTPYVSQRPPFTVFRPDSWKVRYAVSSDSFRIWVTDAGIASQVELALLDNRKSRADSLALLGSKLRELRSVFPDVAFSEVLACKDSSCAAATISYTKQGIPFKGRFYIQSDPEQAVIRGYAGPRERLTSERNLMMNILANIRWGSPRAATSQGAPAPQSPPPPLQIQLVPRRAADGSTSMLLPADWSFQAQKGRVLAVAPEGTVCAGFIFTVFQVLPPTMRIPPNPEIIISPYLPPSRFIPLVFQKFGNRNIRLLQSAPDQQAAGECLQRFGSPCEVEKMILSWDSPRGQPCMGGLFVLNGRPGPVGTWSSLVAGLWGPAGDIARYVPALDRIGKSFAINDQYAANYIQEGLIALRAQQQRTQEAMRDLNRAREDNQRAWEARQDRKDASDARWDDYRRGNSYWISELEGGKVYQTDPWGTRDTVTGDRVDGRPYDYVHFEGQNPRHPSENMREVSSYEVQKMMGR